MVINATAKLEVQFPGLAKCYWVFLLNSQFYYMGPKKHTGELWVYIDTPLPNPFGEYRRDCMLCYVGPPILLEIRVCRYYLDFNFTYPGIYLCLLVVNKYSGRLSSL